jgi:enoyl-CoA hydratase/carnithine racemase
MTDAATTFRTQTSDRDRIAGVPCLRLLLRNDAGKMRLTPELIDDLISAIDRDRTSRLAIVEGTADSFCEGLDIESLGLKAESAAPPSCSEIGLTQYEKLLTTINCTPRPVVAVVSGQALGGGVGIACAADLVLASPQATFALPETILGMIPAVVFPFIASRIGVPRARLLALGAKPLSAATALQWGLVDEIAEDLEAAIARHARRFARMDSRAIATVKRLAADHFAKPNGYQADASSSLLDLLASSETRSRLRRFAIGESPWSDETEI